MELEKIYTDDNSSDIMTETLPKGKFETYQFISRLTFVFLKSEKKFVVYVQLKLGKWHQF